MAAVIDAGACPSQPTTVVDLTPMGTAARRSWCGGPRRAGGARPLIRPGRSETIGRWTISNLIQTVLVYALPVLFAITVHEAAHGYVARYLGDDTA